MAGIGAWAGAAALMGLVPQIGWADAVLSARLTDPTQRYAHGVFGDDTTYGTLEISVDTCPACARIKLEKRLFVLPETRVFEDREARVEDLDGDGLAEVIVVETDLALGASLAIYGEQGKRTATDFIGQPRRWLAPAGVGDFDGDGRVEIAYVDRPHLKQDLVFLRYAAGRLTEIARAPDLTNHTYGAAHIAGGVRRCDGHDSLIVTSGDGARVVEVTLQGGAVQRRDLGPARDDDPDLARAMICP